MNSQSYFWRHPDQLSDLRDQLAILPIDKKVMRVWCAGCSLGQEAFSVAALLAGLGRDFEMIATDINPSNITTAKKGVFSMRQTPKFPGHLQRFFEKSGDDFRLRIPLLDKITFEIDDLRAPQITGDFDLIICRNVLIYFTPTESRSVLTFFRENLNKDGLLVLGYAEATLSNLSSFESTGRHATYTLPAADLPPISPRRIPPPLVVKPLSLATKAFAEGRLKEAKQLFEASLEMRPVPQISFYFLTLLALDTGERDSLPERIRHLRDDLDFSDSISRRTLEAHEISPKRFQQTLSRLFARYERSL